MKVASSFIVIFLALAISSCSGGKVNPVSPQDDSQKSGFQTMDASDVLYSHASHDLMAYKAFGIYQVVIDLKSLNAEIIPSRKARKIGDTVDADLTQFLTVSPCTNCLQVDGIELIGTSQVKVGFAVKHPFSDITKRPDLHGFDVRGIVIAKGNFNFQQAMVITGPMSFEPARANVSLVSNADGWTHHFDELAADPHYFNPPRNYDANINPFKRYFVDPGTGAFDPHSPSGHNVMKVGSSWETQDFIFNMPSVGTSIDFAFICDIGYGQSATFQNRQNPFYFLPEFNRKEAWKVDFSVVSNSLKAGNSASSATIRLEVCDWQAGLTADPNYPDTDNLDGISEKSDVKTVGVYIPGVCNMVQSSTPVSGNGNAASPYIFDVIVTNGSLASADYYWGIASVQDDLYGQQGPPGIPENPISGFPFKGPDIYDYAVYKIFQIRVGGAPPAITEITAPATVVEGEVIHFQPTITEPDGDDLQYVWIQTSPANPRGRFEDSLVEDAYWEAPQVNDIPLSGLDFTIRLTVSDLDGSDEQDVQFKVLDKNSPPVCDHITRIPYHGIANVMQDLEFSALAHDPDGDTLVYEWDYDFDGAMFDQDDTGQTVTHQYENGGFYTIACRISEDRPYPNQTICTTQMMIEGKLLDTYKVDNSIETNPRFIFWDVKNINGVNHVVYQDLDDLSLYYCRDIGRTGNFFLHKQIFDGSSYDSVHDVCLAGNGNTIHVAWLADQPSHLDIDLMITSSTNGGITFDAYGGTRIITSTSTPLYLDHISMCSSILPSDYYIMYEMHADAGPTEYVASDLKSSDNGDTWGNPPSDTIYSEQSAIENPTIQMSADGTLHAFWYAEITSPRYLYNWSTDGGTIWHTEETITNPSMTVDPEFATMTATSSKPHFVWTEASTNKIFYRSLYSHVPFQMNPIVDVRTVNTNMRGLDIYVSPTEKTVMIPFTFWTNNPVFMASVGVHYSLDSGSSFTESDITWSTDNLVQFYEMGCDGKFSEDPDRVELFTAWTQGGDPEGHIYGGYYYLAERF